MSRYYRYRIDYTQDEEKHMSQFGPLLNPNPNRIQDGGILVGVQDFGKELSPSLVMRMLRYKFGTRNILVVQLTKDEYDVVCASFDRLVERHN